MLEELGWIKNLKVKASPSMTPEKWTDLWIYWADKLGFLYLTNTYGMIVRPINEDMVPDITADYFGTLFEFDKRFGTIAVIDFAYGPGHYPDLIRWLKSCGCKEMAWEHQKTGRVWRMPLEKLPSVIPFKTPEDTKMGYPKT
jgi:hypothetical protein